MQCANSLDPVMGRHSFGLQFGKVQLYNTAIATTTMTTVNDNDRNESTTNNDDTNDYDNDNENNSSSSNTNNNQRATDNEPRTINNKSR